MKKKEKKTFIDVLTPYLANENSIVFNSPFEFDRVIITIKPSLTPGTVAQSLINQGMVVGQTSDENDKRLWMGLVRLDPTMNVRMLFIRK